MLTEKNSVNSNQEIIKSYLQGYRNGCEYSKVKLIEVAYEWLENNVENYIIRVDSDAWFDSDLKEDFKKYLKGVLVD